MTTTVSIPIGTETQSTVQVTVTLKNKPQNLRLHFNFGPHDIQNAKEFCELFAASCLHYGHLTLKYEDKTERWNWEE